MLQSGVFVVQGVAQWIKTVACVSIDVFDAVMQRPIVPSDSQFPAAITSFDFLIPSSVVDPKVPAPVLTVGQEQHNERTGAGCAGGVGFMFFDFHFSFAGFTTGTCCSSSDNELGSS
jgi:hypothetical protein